MSLAVSGESMCTWRYDLAKRDYEVGNPVQPCATLCNPVQPCATLCNPVQPCAILCNPVQPFYLIFPPLQPPLSIGNTPPYPTL